MSAAVPKRIVKNREYTDVWSQEEANEIVDKTGIEERRFADENTCSSDLCFAAAEKLFADNEVNREEIDLLVFISQTPDYRMPATSVILQHRLGLPNTTIAFDITLGCSAWMYGLSVVYGFSWVEVVIWRKNREKYDTKQYFSIKYFAYLLIILTFADRMLININT